MIRELVADGTTLLLTTQYLEEADVLAERLAVIDHGQVIAEGTPGELKARLGATVLEVGFDDDASARAAVAVIGAVAPGGDLHGRVLHITVDDGPKVAMEVLRALDQAAAVGRRPGAARAQPRRRLPHAHRPSDRGAFRRR